MNVNNILREAENIDDFIKKATDMIVKDNNTNIVITTEGPISTNLTQSIYKQLYICNKPKSVTGWKYINDYFPIDIDEKLGYWHNTAADSFLETINKKLKSRDKNLQLKVQMRYDTYTSLGVASESEKKQVDMFD